MQSAQFELHARIERWHWWFVARRQIMRRLIEQVLPPNQQKSIVDVGCGTGGNLADLADDYKCIGIDTSGDAIQRARERFPQVDFLHGYAPHDLGERADQADLFLLMDVLEHVPDDFTLFSELLEASRPGSYFLVTVPANAALWSEHDESFGHYRRYDAERLAKVWEGLPVHCLLHSYYNTRLYPIVRAIRCFNRLRGHSGGAAGTDFSLPRPSINQWLTRTFAAEADVLIDALHGQPEHAYHRGVSLVALLQRVPGEVQVRQKPPHVAPDLYNPADAELVAVG
jgi:SAM-dependent methyltransferase